MFASLSAITMSRGPELREKCLNLCLPSLIFRYLALSLAFYGSSPHHHHRPIHPAIPPYLLRVRATTLPVPPSVSFSTFCSTVLYVKLNPTAAAAAASGAVLSEFGNYLPPSIVPSPSPSISSPSTLKLFIIIRYRASRASSRDLPLS